MDKKIIDYKVVSGVVSGTMNIIIDEIVQMYIEQGWQPFGNLCINDDYFYQAMVKYEE